MTLNLKRGESKPAGISVGDRQPGSPPPGGGPNALGVTAAITNLNFYAFSK